jgi:ATP-dependent Clp protease adaptor protein ClpS
MEPMRVSPAPLPQAVRPSSVPTRVEEVTGETDVAPEHLWRLVLLDDDDHSYEYVIEMLGGIFGYGPEKAFALARLVDSHGRVTLMTAEKVECEAKQSQIHAYGADPRILASKGSMSACSTMADTV